MTFLPAIRRRSQRKAQEYPYHDPGDLATEHGYFQLLERIREDILHQRSHPLEGPRRRMTDLARAILPGPGRRRRRAMLAAALLLMGAGRKP